MVNVDFLFWRFRKGTNHKRTNDVYVQEARAGQMFPLVDRARAPFRRQLFGTNSSFWVSRDRQFICMYAFSFFNLFSVCFSF